jgi:hypothetical protein
MHLFLLLRDDTARQQGIDCLLGATRLAVDRNRLESDLVIPSHGCFVILISCHCPISSKGRSLSPNRVLLRRLVNDCSPRLLHFGAAD